MHPISALRELQGAGRRELLLDSGVTKASIARALHGGLIDRTYRGVYSLPGTPQRVIDARMYRGQVTCASWAEHLGLPLLHEPTKTHLLVPHDRARRRDDRRPIDSVVLHRSDDATLGLLATPIAAFANMAECLDARYVVAAADAAVARGLITRGELFHLPHTGIDLRKWLTLTVDQRSQSFIESLTRHALASAGYEVYSQVHFRGIGDVDFVIGNLVIECDGYEFHSKVDDFCNDRRRAQLLIAAGYTVLRFTYWDCVYRMDHVLAIVAATIARAN
jgi:very-short-patch-repair endonuclease